MNQIEEFNNYYLQQWEEYSEESEYEELIEKEEEKINISVEESKIKKIKNLNSATSKRLSVLPKRYQIYTLEYKKKILEEVNK